MQEQAGEYNLSVTDRGIVVRYNKPQVVNQTLYKDGAFEQAQCAVTDLMPNFSPILLEAHWTESGWWVDHEAGFMRWCGYMSGHKLAAGLRKLGFSARDAMNAARKSSSVKSRVR